MKSKSTMNSELMRYLWIGAAFGLYFGWFFRPASEPNFLFPILLALVATVGMFFFRLYQRGRDEIGRCLREMPLNFVQYAALLVILETRHYAHDMGGRILTAVYMIVMGTLAGALIWWKSHGKES